MKKIVFKFEMDARDHSNGASPKSQTSRGNMIKKTILTGIFSCIILGSSAQDAAQGVQIHAGIAVPVGAFANDSKVKFIDNGAGHASMGFNAGIKYYVPLASANGLSFVIALDMFYNPIQSDYVDDIKDKVEEDHGDITISKYMNLPLTAGLNYQYAVSSSAALYGEFGAGINYSKLTNMKATYEEYEEDDYYEGNGEYITSYNAKFGFAYGVEGGVLLNKKVNIGLRYNGLGSYKFKGKSVWTDVEGTYKENIKFNKSLPINNLSIVLGIRF